MKSLKTNRRDFLKRSSLFTLGITSLAINTHGNRLHAAKNKKPNILLIVSDDHGWGDFPGNWKDTDVIMPRLDGIGKSGIRFTEYHTEPLCGPARAGILTGQTSMECGMWRGPGKNKFGSKNYRGVKYDVKMLPPYALFGGCHSG